MSTIQVSCTDQVLALNNRPVIASGGIKEDFISVDFCELWAGFAKTAVFWHDDDTEHAYPVLLDASGSGEIPWEVLTEGGTVSFGVYGVDGSGVRRTSDIIKYKIKQGAFLATATPSTPSPEVWEQLEAQCASALAGVANKANKVSGAVAGNLAALSADGDLVDSGKSLSSIQIGRLNISDGAIDNAKLDLSAGFSPAGAIYFSKDVQFFESLADLPAPNSAKPGRIFLVKGED